MTCSKVSDPSYLPIRMIQNQLPLDRTRLADVPDVDFVAHPTRGELVSFLAVLETLDGCLMGIQHDL